MRVLGAVSDLGNGTVSSYVEMNEDDTPASIGVVFSAAAMDGLPAEGSDRHHCFDRNNDGNLDHDSECLEAYEFVIPLPDKVARNPDVPFKWVLLNWNPAGHIPPGIYDVPHFDVHFYMEPIEKVFALKEGPCGPEYVRCDQFEAARKPLPPGYVHPDYKDVEAVVPAMGNHLVDLSSPEFHGKDFTRTFIYGTYDGRVTFYEEMVTRAFILSSEEACFPIKSPASVEISGFYPTASCIRQDAQTGEYTVSMEDFIYREAVQPGATG